MSPAAPDYADPLAWFGGQHAPPDDAPALFYVHPTTTAADSWNWLWHEAAASDAATEAVVARQTAPFDCCRIFAPRYRQATGRAFRARGQDADAAYARAYDDVRAAFRHYLRHHHRGRLVLAGHSQGALHVGRLLAELVEPEGLTADLVAAYGIGIGFSEGLFGRWLRIVQPCARPDQTGCLVSWNSFAIGGDPAPFLRRAAERDAAVLGGAAPGLPVCINPISFDARHPDMAEPPGARVQGGVVWVSDPPADLPPLPGGNLHMHDIALFAPSLRADVRRRLAVAG